MSDRQQSINHYHGCRVVGEIVDGVRQYTVWEPPGRESDCLGMTPHLGEAIHAARTRQPIHDEPEEVDDLILDVDDIEEVNDGQ